MISNFYKCPNCGRKFRDPTWDRCGNCTSKIIPMEADMKIINRDDVYYTMETHHIRIDAESYHTLTMYSNGDLLKELRGSLYQYIIVESKYDRGSEQFTKYRPIRYINHVNHTIIYLD